MNDPVVAAEGLAGKITQTTPNTAQVTLITDADSAVTARVTPSGATGVVEPDVGNPNDLQLDYLERGPRSRRGQMVVTAGFSTGDLGSIFPPGIPIGKITTGERGGAAGVPAGPPRAVRRPARHGLPQGPDHALGEEQPMILTRGIIVRLAVLGALVAVAQVVCFSKMDIFGTSPGRRAAGRDLGRACWAGA